MSVSSTSTVGSTSSTAPTTQNRSLMGTDDFLKLLVAQLKNQDPMNPTSGTEFMAQTAQFSAVEKLTQLNQQYTDMITAQRAVEATAFLGRTVGYTDSMGNPASGLVSSVTLAVGGPVLHIGTTDVPLASISTVTR